MRVRIPSLIALIALSLVLAACGGGAATELPTAAIVPTTAPLPTDPPLPLALLITPAGSDAALAAAAAEVTGSYAAANGLQFEQRETLDAGQIPAELALLVAMAPDPGAAAYAAAAPQARVVAVGFSPQDSLDNLSSLPLAGGGDGQAAFVAGYIAALIADDWRMAMLYTDASQAITDDFVTGAEYFCGACIPEAPPDVDFPLAVQTDPANWQPAADELALSGIRVVYLTEEFKTSGIAAYLAQFGVLFVGSGDPPAELAGNWIASVGADAGAALREALPALLAGESAPSGSAVTVTQVNPAYLSEGRLSSVQEVISDLASGYLALP